MADLKITPHALGWGRLPDGRFVINVNLQVPTSSGDIISVPAMGFILTKDEEKSLSASLAGLTVITQGLPITNGRH